MGGGGLIRTSKPKRENL